MADWIEYAKIIGGFVGAAGIATVAKLYHGKVVAGKDTELTVKDAEIARLRSDLARAETRTQSEEAFPGQRDLAKLRGQLADSVERLAKSLDAQAASLYIPVYSVHDDQAEVPRGFAFVAVYNVDPSAANAILRMKLVETWTVVGECWVKGTVLGDNELQANVRHVASYDKQSGFVPVHTLLSPVRWQNRQVGVLQVFNKTVPGSLYDIDSRGFGSEDRKRLAEALQDPSDAGLAARTQHFLSNADCARLLGLQDELNLENAVIMYVDLTRSSMIFSELPLLDAAQLINRFNENLYQRIGPFNAVVERFNGDGTLVRFHYGGLGASLRASNPAFRAVCAASDLVKGFNDFKATRWKDLADEVANAVKLRVAISLGPVVSMNVGPRQFQAPTVMGQCVNRAAKMIAYAPRDHDVVLVDGNVRKSLLQIDRANANALRPCDQWSDAVAPNAASLAGYQYYEVDLEPFRAAAVEIRLGAQTRLL
jgi:class 3 adenylate cyclase